MKSFSSALVGMRRSPYQSLAAVIMVTLTFFVGYAFTLFIIGAERILQYFETQPQVIAFFTLDADPTTIESAAKTMQSKSYVEKVTVVDKQKALELYQQDNQDDPLLLELVTAEILPASIEVSGKTASDLPKIKEDLNQISQIDEVIFQQDIIESLTSWTRAVRLIGLGSTVVLALSSFLTVLVIIGIKVTIKKQAINIMRMIGATRWYITLPFLYEGMVYGFVGSLIGWGFMYGLLLYLTPWLKNFLGSIAVLPVPWELLGLQLATGSFLGMVLGGLTGIIATRRLIRR